MAENVDEFTVQMYKKGEYAKCPCPAGTFLQAVLVPGRMPECVCGMTYQKAEEKYENELLQKWKDNEAANWSDDDSDDGKAGGGTPVFKPIKFKNWPITISKGLQKFYQSIVLAYKMDKKAWDDEKSTIGDDPNEALELLNSKYVACGSSSEKGKLVQPLKDANNHTQTIAALEAILA